MRKQYLALILVAAITLPQILGTGQVAYASQMPEEQIAEREENGDNDIEEKQANSHSNAILPQSVENKCGKNLTWSFNNTTGTLTISGTGAMYDYSAFDDAGAQISPWRDEYESLITKVVISNGVTTIGTGAFSFCDKLANITIPNSVTSIDYEAFRGCTGLINVTLPNRITCIGSGAFQECSSLKSINIPDSVTEIGNGAFAGCSSLKSINIPDSVTEISGYAFCGCSSLISITIPDSVTALSFCVFADCSSLKSVTLPNELTDIQFGVFQYCNSLTSITIPSKVTDIGNGAFFDCSALKDITILSKSCKIWGNGDTISSTATIHGYSGSTAQDFANIYNRRFVELKESVKEPVKESAIKVNKISISGPSHKIAVGKKVTLKAIVSPSNATNKAVTWKSSNTKYATVNSKGVITMKKAGKGKTVTITATAKDGSQTKAAYKIKCMKGVVKKIKLTAAKSVKAGKKVTVKKKVTASKGANTALTYSVSNKKYATVSKKGVVTTKKAGKGKTITVTAKATDGSGKKASVKIKIR